MIASIIICTRNRCAALRETLNALEALQVPSGMNVEAIVIDNGSTDDTMAVVQQTRLSHLELKYVLENRAGKSNALNTGIRTSRGEILVFTDDDVRPEADWLAQISKPIIDNQYDAVTGTIRIAPHLMRPWMTDMHLAWLASTHYLDPKKPETAVGANMAVARKVLDRVPGFDPELGPGRLGLWEDTLFSLQLKQAGFRLGMAPEAVVEHHFDPSRLMRRSFIAHAESIGRSDAYVTWHWKHESPPAALAKIIRFRLEICIKRVLRWKDWHQTEGMPVWELNLLSGISFYEQILIERKCRRAYQTRGIKKTISANSK